MNKDSQLVNAFLSAEGTRFIQVGSVVCSAVRSGVLRLSFEAVDLILSSLEEMLSSYAYSRDEGLLQLALDFMSCAGPIWLAPEHGDSDLCERVIYLAKFLITKAIRDQISSWRVRLAIICFIDEYLTIDPAGSAWSKVQDDNGDLEDSPWGPLGIVAYGLIDRDARVRFRAATSTARLFYSSAIPPSQHNVFYHEAVRTLPGQPKHWDSFITDLLWKLNCCVSSGQLRADAIYHLYEIPFSCSDYNHHLQVGLEAVARNLGLDGIASLYLPHAALVIASQLTTGQSPLRVPHQLCGSSSRRLLAINSLATAGPAILASITHQSAIDERMQARPGQELFASLCEAAGLQQSEAVLQYFPAVAAMIYGNVFGGAIDKSSKEILTEVTEAVALLPGLEARSEPSDLLLKTAERSAAHLFSLLDLASTQDKIAHELDMGIYPSAVFSRLMAYDLPADESPPALYPTLPADVIIRAQTYLFERYPSLSASKMVMDGLLRLFYGINHTFLVSEQRRYLRSIALLVALHPAEFRHPTILQLFLLELIALLDHMEDSRTALAFLKWGFFQIPSLHRPMYDLVDIFVRLGSARMALSKRPIAPITSSPLHSTSTPSVRPPTPADIGDELEAWIIEELPSWQKIDAVRSSLEMVLGIWPVELTRHIRGWKLPVFLDLCDLAEMDKATDPTALCKRLVETVSEGNVNKNTAAFQDGPFWHLKKAISPTTCEHEGIMAFLDLLYLGEGQVHAPGIDAIKRLNGDQLNDNLRSRVKGDPASFGRAVIIGRLARLTLSSDYRLRAVAVKTLQSISTALGDIPGRDVVSPLATDLLELLIPDDTSARLSRKPDNLRAHFEDENRVKQSRSVSEWASGLATVLCDVLAEDEAC